MTKVLDIVGLVLTAALGGIALYFKHSLTAQKKAKEIQATLNQVKDNTMVMIARAEEAYVDTTKAGGRKFEYVVTRLYDMVPVALRGIITREMIEDIVQSTFDEMQTFVQTQLDEKMK